VLGIQHLRTVSGTAGAPNLLQDRLHYLAILLLTWPIAVLNAYLCYRHLVFHSGTDWRRVSSDAQPERTYKIGHAVSPDGVAWMREDGRRVIGDRLGPDESQALPSVIKIGGQHHMFFCYRESVDFRANPARGYRIGHAVSDDLRSWARDDDFLLPPGEPGEWDAEMQCYPHVFESDGRVLMLYNGNGFGRFGFGAAVLET
jgi:hypothetical protein